LRRDDSKSAKNRVESRKTVVFSFGRANSRLAPPLRTATSTKPSQPSNAPFLYFTQILVVKRSDASTPFRPSTLQAGNAPPHSNANNDAKTGGKLRASRRDLRTIGAAAKQIRFSIMILTFWKKSQCFTARKQKKSRKTPDFIDYAVDCGRRRLFFTQTAPREN
jgi:hypothetical protein